MYSTRGRDIAIAQHHSPLSLILRKRHYFPITFLPAPYTPIAAALNLSYTTPKASHSRSIPHSFARARARFFGNTKNLFCSARQPVVYNDFYVPYRPTPLFLRVRFFAAFFCIIYTNFFSTPFSRKWLLYLSAARLIFGISNVFIVSTIFAHASSLSLSLSLSPSLSLSLGLPLFLISLCAAYLYLPPRLPPLAFLFLTKHWRREVYLKLRRCIITNVSAYFKVNLPPPPHIAPYFISIYNRRCAI